jgi:Protein of unknown function (DUF3016)
MNLRVKACVFALAAAFGLPAAATVTVNFVTPEKYTDIGRRTSDAADTQRRLEEHIQKLAQRHLPANADLVVDVLDVDLAGRQNVASRDPDLRVMKGRADWPAFQLRYSLKSGDKVLASGEERIADMNYQKSVGAHQASDPLRYEMRLLDDWFKKRIVPAAAR